MTFRPSVLTSVFTAALQAALAALSLLVVAPQARGDLEWFEWGRWTSPDLVDTIFQRGCKPSDLAHMAKSELHRISGSLRLGRTDAASVLNFACVFEVSL